MSTRQLAHTPYLSQFEGVDSAVLSDWERAVAATMETPGWAVLVGMWERRENDLSEQLIWARLEPEEYAVKVTHVRGLREAREAPRALAEVAQRKREKAEAEHV